MAKLVCSGNDIGFTILPSPNISLEELVAYPSDHVLGYITSERKFTYVESLTKANTHWSLSILDKFPYNEQGPWIVYTCPPAETMSQFGKILDGESLHIYLWDTWSVKGKNANVAVVTSWEIY